MTMPRLTLPLKRALKEGFDEADVQRIWRGVLARSTRGPSAAAAWRWLVPRAALAMAVLAAVLVFGKWYRASRGPLELAAGGRLPSQLVVASSEAKRWVELADGSRIGLGPGTELDVLANSQTEFLTLLNQGRSTFEVRPGGTRRWVIECGLATVEVLGTKFSIERSPERLQILVSSGVVLVRGELVPGRVQRCRAGEHIVVTDPAMAVARAVPSVPELPIASASPSNDHTTPSDSPALPYAGASARNSSSAEPAPSSGRHAELDELVTRADSARQAGNFDQAAALLERAVEVGGTDPRAAIAALTLARLAMHRSPERASRALSAVLATGAPRGLEEDAMARLVEARARAGDRDGARQAALDYERRFPDGARLAEVKRWSAD
jgi:transmembrane sensor